MEDAEHDDGSGASVATGAEAGDATKREPPERRGGGTGNAGGVDLHAMAMVLAAVALMRGSKLGWLDGVANDVPVAVTAETGGSGDDIGLQLADGSAVEVQSKKNLQRGAELWTALEDLIDGVSSGAVAHGVLVVSADSSGPVRGALAKDVVLIGQGQTGTLTAIGKAWLRRLEEAGRDPAACAHVRIKTLNLLDGDGADQRTALVGLEAICAAPSRAEAAMDHLFRDAVRLQKSRGRWTLATLVGRLRSHGIDVRQNGTPVGLAANLAGWAERNDGAFLLPAGMRAIPIAEMLPTGAVTTSPEPESGVSASVALERYHSGEVKALDDLVYEGAWLGRFRPRAVLVAGPGLGKSTLARRIAWENARDGVPVLLVPLAAVAKAMRNGATFETALWAHGLDGSGIDPVRAREAFRGELVVVADGLDETRELRGDVAAGLASFAAGAPGATLVVTTRPIGYETARLAGWRHYRLRRPDAKLGAVNLGRLVALGRGLPGGDAGSLVLAKEALAATPAAEAIGASPLLLGMAASLVIRDLALPGTRPKLYEAMIGLFETRDARPPGFAGPLVSRVLDIVGWELVHRPNQTWGELERAVCDRLAVDLGGTLLAASSRFAGAFAHWERAGIVERLQFGADQLVSFSHRTFAEFAAARFLVAPGFDSRPSLERMVDDPAFAEVVSFAGALGLGDDIAQLFVERRGRGAEGQFERALALAGDRDAAVADAKVTELVDGAFDLIASGAGDRFAVGSALAKLASRRRALVAPSAYDRLGDADYAVRLAAAACLVKAEPARLDAAALTDLLDDLGNRVAPVRPPSGGAIRAARTGRDVDLLDIVALAALEAQPVVEMERFVDERLSGGDFDRLAFQRRVEGVLVANGLKHLDSRWRRWALSTAAMVAMVAPDYAWKIAANRATAALASAVAFDGIGAPEPSVVRLPQFSALHQLAGVAESDAIDVHSWTPDHDGRAVAEVVRALAALSRIDPVALGVEARAVLDVLSMDPGRSPFLAGLTAVDIPEPDWSRADALDLDRGLVETAFHHGSSWLRLVSANLLANMPGTRDDHARLLARSRGDELRYASEVVGARVTAEAWWTLVLDRVSSGPPGGLEHLFGGMAARAGRLPPGTGPAIAVGLRSNVGSVVESASKLGARWVDEGGALDADAAREAYRATLGREDANGLGEKTMSAAAVAVAAIRLLAAAGLLTGGLLRLALSDPREPARAVARRAADAEGGSAGLPPA